MPAQVATIDNSAPDYGVVHINTDITRSSAIQVRTTLNKALAARHTVLADLGAVRGIEPVWATLFAGVLTAGGGWPWAKLACFGASEDVARVLAATRINRLVPCWPEEAAAAAGIQQRPPRVRHSALLGCCAGAPAQARALAKESCEAWNLPAATRETAALLASELVTNAVQHAGTDIVLTLDATALAVTVSARDFAGGQPQLHPTRAGAPPRVGLVVVAAVADYWGVVANATGKTVWARLPLPGTRRRRFRFRSGDGTGGGGSRMTW